MDVNLEPLKNSVDAKLSEQSFAFEEAFGRVIGVEVLKAFKQIIFNQLLENSNWKMEDLIKLLVPVADAMISFEVLQLDADLPQKVPAADLHCKILNADFKHEDLRTLDARMLSAVLIFLADQDSAYCQQQKWLLRHFPSFESLRNSFHQLGVLYLEKFSGDRDNGLDHERLQSQLAYYKSQQPELSKTPYCTHPFDRVRVNSEGNVYPCCFQRHMPLGNVFQEDLQSILDGELFRDLRFSVENGILHPMCRVSCPFNFIEKTRCENPVTKVENMDIDPPNTHCNVGGNKPTEKNPSCRMCEREAPGYRWEVDRSHEMLPKVKSIVPGLRVIHIQGVSEIFWKDLAFKYLDLLEYDKHRETLHVTTTSNGTVFTPEKQLRWVNRVRSSGMGFSLDAATAETYVKIRRLNVFERVQDHLLHYTELVNAAPIHRFRIINNVNKLNAKEVYDMVAFASRTAAYEIEFQLTSDNGRCADILITPADTDYHKLVSEQLLAAEKDFKIPIIRFRGIDLNWQQD